MSSDLIIFDMDGTLVNSSLTIANAINHVRKQLGFEMMESEHILKLVNDHTINPAQTFYHTARFEPEHERLFRAYYTDNHKSELVLYDGVKELLELLKSKGDRVALATNAYRSSTLESLTHLDLLNYFDAIACFDDVARGKPHPDMLLKVLEETGHSSDNAIFIGDGSRDEIASKRAKIPYIMVDWGFSEHSSAVRSIEKLKEILINKRS